MRTDDAVVVDVAVDAVHSLPAGKLAPAAAPADFSAAAAVTTTPPVSPVVPCDPSANAIIVVFIVVVVVVVFASILRRKEAMSSIPLSPPRPQHPPYVDDAVQEVDRWTEYP